VWLPPETAPERPSSGVAQAGTPPSVPGAVGAALALQL